MNVLTAAQIKDAIAQHRAWLDSGGGSGVRADFQNADMRGACGMLIDVNLTGADMRGVILTDVDMRGAIFTDADMRGADLRYADLRCADLRHTRLQGAVMRHANLGESDLTGAEMSGADLHDTGIRPERPECPECPECPERPERPERPECPECPECGECGESECPFPAAAAAVEGLSYDEYTPALSGAFIYAKQTCRLLRDAKDRSVPYASWCLSERRRADALQLIVDKMRAVLGGLGGAS